MIMRSTFKTVFYVNGSKEKNNFAPNKKNDYAEHFQDSLLCKRKQGKERNCPHYRTSYNQRDYRTVLQLQTGYLPNKILYLCSRPDKRM